MRNCVQQSTSWEGDVSSASEEIPRVYKNVLPPPKLSQINPAHASITLFEYIF
jgi:hypothetical protein